jgi:inner membrane protein
MNGSMVIKLLAIGVTALVLLVPLDMVSGKISERRAIRDSVVRGIAESSSGAQVLSGIAVITPCIESWIEFDKDERGHRIERQRNRDCTHRQLPRTLTIDGAFDTETRYRGIYRALVYIGKLGVSGSFTFEPLSDDVPEGRTRKWGASFLSIGIEDARGIKNTPVLRWGNGEITFTGGAGRAPWQRGLHAYVPIDARVNGNVDFAFALDLAGMESVEFVPTAGEQIVNLSARWPHPSFMGRFLPDKRVIEADNFSAIWRVTDFASSARQLMAQCPDDACKGFNTNRFGVAFIHTVDVYQRAWRATNYGMLFVLLTFAVFLVFEATHKLAIHPMQYALVGAALAMFFLLLIALSEHLRFLFAYVAGAVACIGLITVYCGYALTSRALAAVIGAFLIALYTALYFVLGLEDYAFLMGALLTFAALAGIMLATGRIDWYALSARVVERARIKRDTGGSTNPQAAS